MQVAISWVWGWSLRPKDLHWLTSGTREYQRNLALNLNQQGNSEWDGMCSKTPTNTTIFSNHCNAVNFSPCGVYFWLVVLLYTVTFSSAANLNSFLNLTLPWRFNGLRLQRWVSKLACCISSSVQSWWYLGECDFFFHLFLSPDIP